MIIRILNAVVDHVMRSEKSEVVEAHEEAARWKRATERLANQLRISNGGETEVYIAWSLDEP